MTDFAEDRGHLWEEVVDGARLDASLIHEANGRKQI